MGVRDELTATLLSAESRNFKHYLRRAIAHLELGYSDLAAGDAYRALTLLEGYFDPESSQFEPGQWDEGRSEFLPWPRDEQALLDAHQDLVECLKTLVQALADLGCSRDAYAYLLQLCELDSAQDISAKKTYQELLELVLRNQRMPYRHSFENSARPSLQSVELARLPYRGSARREIYTWNEHEPVRSSPQCLRKLNGLLKDVASNLEVRAVRLPALTASCLGQDPALGSPVKPSAGYDLKATSLQLGLFAKTEVTASLTILREASALTAVRPLYASICDNCASNISDSPSSSVSPDADGASMCCPSCADAAIFCCQACIKMAQTQYHSTTCGNEDVELLGRDDNSEHPSEDLYSRLLVRAFAMSHSQGVHPLELPEVKYLWGDFTTAEGLTSGHGQRSHGGSLPFTFQHNIVLPFRLLSTLCEEHPEMSPFSARGIDWYDVWVVETLYAKFRGVASARQSTWDGKPEVAAVHPLWCLANHSCAPNVGWSWGRERTFSVRQKPVIWGEGGGRESLKEQDRKVINAGEEILSHYCDLDLPVTDRREYMLGSLGGACRCERCLWEAEHAQQTLGGNK